MEIVTWYAAGRNPGQSMTSHTRTHVHDRGDIAKTDVENPHGRPLKGSCCHYDRYGVHSPSRSRCLPIDMDV